MSTRDGLGRSRGLIWDVPHTIAFLSQYYESCPAVVFTGTPAGVGPSSRAIVSTAASRLGTLAISIVAPII
jgi:2-keto-4-pentenoate hydratase/2-oxohepta-3-ene-1,7-dioic acid hydratase in catechol pathway